MFKLKKVFNDQEILGAKPPRFYYFAYSLYSEGLPQQVFYIFPLNKLAGWLRNFKFWMHNLMSSDVATRIHNQGREIGYSDGYERGYNSGKRLSEDYIEMYRSTGVVPKAEAERYKALVFESRKYLIEVKAKFAPHTTNSLIDDFIAKTETLK